MDGRENHKDMVASSLLSHTKITEKPALVHYSADPNTVGDHIRKVRIGRDLSQYEVGVFIGVSEATITLWENNKTTPYVRYYPKILVFLGYNLFDLPTDTFGQRITQFRYARGLSAKAFGQIINVDMSTVRSWELEEHTPPKQLKEQVELIFATSLE